MSGSEIINDYFARGFVEELMTDLSQFQSLRVISSYTARKLRSRDGRDALEASRELGIRFLLRGALIRRKDHLRITPQLIDVETGEVQITGFRSKISCVVRRVRFQGTTRTYTAVSAKAAKARNVLCGNWPPSRPARIFDAERSTTIALDNPCDAGISSPAHGWNGWNEREETVGESSRY